MSYPRFDEGDRVVITDKHDSNYGRTGVVRDYQGTHVSVKMLGAECAAYKEAALRPATQKPLVNLDKIING
jgi:hypothetical protein